LAESTSPMQGEALGPALAAGDPRITSSAEKAVACSERTGCPDDAAGCLAEPLSDLISILIARY